MDKFKISSLTPGPLVLILAIATLIGVPLRTFQLSNCIDSSTGFWVVEDITVPILYALCVLVTIIAFGISFFSGIMPKPEFSEKRNIPIGITATLLSITFLADAVIQMGTYISLIGDYVSGTGMSLILYLITTGALALTMQSIFGLFAAFYLALIAFSSFLGNNNYGKTKLAALTPILWGICRMVYYFVNPINYKNVSQLLLDLGTLTFFMVFFLSFARIASKINEKSSMWILWFSGTAGAFFAYVSALAPLVLIITGKSNLICPNYPMQYTNLMFGFFATAVLLSNLPRTVANKTES